MEIITTCARDYGTWADYYPPGEDRVDGVVIRRFPVDRPRDVRAFDRLSRRLRSHVRTATPADIETWMRAQGPYSTPLLDDLRARAGDYERFFFFTYLYATTYFGLPEVAQKAWLLPLAHDEWMIQLPFWDGFFQRPAGFIFNTPEERDFLKRRFPARGSTARWSGSASTFPRTCGRSAFGNATASRARSFCTSAASMRRRASIGYSRISNATSVTTTMRFSSC